MTGNKKVVYWYRRGFKVYHLTNSNVTLEKELKSSDPEQIKTELKYLSGQSVFLLLSDSISYLFEKILDPPLTLGDNFKAKLLDLVKSEIPEDFSEFIWDYKVEKTLDEKQKIIIFAPVKEFQDLIKNISNNLNIKIEAIEPESIASFRDPNPVLGITKKTDIKGKDEEILNLSIAPTAKKDKNLFKIIGLVIFIILIIFTLFFITTSIIQKSQTPKPNLVTDQTPTPTEVSILTPTSTPKDWVNLNLMVQNGTSTAGLASKTALVFKDNGIIQIETGNADNDSYTSNKLIFKENSLKESYQNKFKELIKIDDENINIDNLIKYDVIFILGLN